MMSERKLDGSSTGENESFESPQYRKFSYGDYEIFFQPTTIKRYLETLLKLQNYEEYAYYPINEDKVKSYFQFIATSFDYKKIKYINPSNFENISKINANIGKSGLNYILSVDKVIDLNKPVLLFYGIEHLSAFYLNLHFNFTEENRSLSPHFKKLRKHGINPKNFQNIDFNIQIQELLNYRIELTKIGLAPRFFLILGFPIDDFFITEKKISLLDLLKIFYTKTRIGLSNRIINKFLEDFTKSEIEYQQDLDLLVFYLLSFLFSHLSRYKIYTWQKLLKSEEKNIGFFVNFFINRAKELFIRKIFSLLYYQEEEIRRFIYIKKQPSVMDV